MMTLTFYYCDIDVLLLRFFETNFSLFETNEAVFFAFFDLNFLLGLFRWTIVFLLINYDNNVTFYRRRTGNCGNVIIH